MDLLQDNEWVQVARRAWSNRDFDAARRLYQKAAYGFQEMEPEQVDALRSEVTDFTSEDPVYGAVLNTVRGELAARPGIVQSEIGKVLQQVDAGGDTHELFNYVMYFADFCGAIVRVKAGRSYKLYLPDAPLAELFRE